ncbi:MAG: hypothetical protein R3F19_18425 [Verrucomicrobiales bacterium]
MIQIVGGSSTGRWKVIIFSMRLKFASDLQYPMFGEDGASSFDTLVLDARLNNLWHYGGGSDPTGQRIALFIRDQLVGGICNGMWVAILAGIMCIFISMASYWGIRMLHRASR